MSKREAQARAVQLLEQVGLAELERGGAISIRFALSGGESVQRAMIAMAIEPQGRAWSLPTSQRRRSTSLVQARILALTDGLRVESKMAILLASHDLAVIAGHCGTRVIVMYAGMIMESGPVEAVLQGAW